MITTKTGKYVAQLNVASSPKAEIMGAILMALAQNVRAEDIRPFLKKYGLESIDMQAWYPQQVLLDLYQAIGTSEVNSGENLVAIGMKFIDTVPWPPNVTTIDEAIEHLNWSTGTVMRGIPEEERFTVVTLRPGYALFVANMPYHLDVLYGYLWAVAKRFRPPQCTFAVTLVDNPDPDQYPGNAYEITWS